MLKRDSLKSNSLLSTITDEQWAAIETASANDEQVVIHNKRAEFYAERDKDIFDTFGIEKLPYDGKRNEKNSEYFQRVLDAKVEEATKAANTKLKKIEAEKADIEKQIADGNGSEALKKKLLDKEQEVEKWKADYAAKEQEIANKGKEVLTIAAMAELEKAKGKLKFNPLFEKDKDYHTKLVDQSILAEYTPDKDEASGQTIWRDKKGEIVRSTNPEKLNSPIDIYEVYESRLKPVLDQGRTQTGTGGKGSETRTNAAGLPYISAKSQVDATEQMSEYIVKNGIPRATPEFDAEMVRIREANPEIANLPFKE